MRALLCAVAMAISVPVMAEKLTIERIYGDPDINGPADRFRTGERQREVGVLR